MRWRAIFLDRDGTLIEDVGYPSKPEQVRVLPGTGPALLRLRRAGFLLVIVSNQSGIARGYHNEADFLCVNETIERATGVLFDAAYFCPHLPDAGCPCRKPAPGMLLTAAQEHSIDLAGSIVVGDRVSDALAGTAAGCRAMLIGPEPAFTGSCTTPDFPCAAEAILRHCR